ncbi:hypothetical protein [Dysgonomonas sp. 520]|uniref:hypothetical protein n=1 Tax=Dysgonomonas sp. 520 TaxID=2302931 RepID=UPI0013D41465|nr:hypothetical protein [Dysgonomonas sp. 520]
MKNQIIKTCFIVSFIFASLVCSNAANYELSPSSKVVFECKNVIQVETYSWPTTLVTYPVKFAGNITEKDLVLVNTTTGAKEIFQLSRVKTSGNNLVSADISFLAKLPKDGEYRYELSVQKDANLQSEKIAVSENSSYWEISGSKIQVRLPKSGNISGNDAPAPVLAINQGTSWIGNNKIISPEKKVLSVTSETKEHGALFIEQSIIYKFEGGAEYVADVKLVKDYPFVILDETMNNLSESDAVRMEMEWDGFIPTKRFGTQWDRNLESEDVWLDIDKPVYTSYSKEDPRWTGMGWIEEPEKQMIFRISPFGGNSVREQTPVMSFWEETGEQRELGIFVYDNNRWNDKQYGIWQPTPALSVYFRYTDDKLYFTYPLISGTRSTALSFFKEKEGRGNVNEFNTKLAALANRGGKHNPKDLYYRYSQMLLMQYASLSLDKIKDWQLTYSEKSKRPENPFKTRSAGNKTDFLKQMSVSAMAYYPMGLNFYPGIHSIEHRILYVNYVEDYLRFHKDLTSEQRQSVEALLILGAYVNMLEEMNAIRHSLAGTANMAADGWAVPAQIAFLFPEHPMAKEWADYFEKQLEINGLFYTRPDVNLYESKGGRWVESMGIYNWAFLRPTSHSNIAGELFDGKNRFASPYMAARGRWMRDMLTAPVEDRGRGFPPHGAHGGGYLVPRYLLMYQTAEWLKNYDPILSENIFWTGQDGEEVEKKATDTDWESAYKTVHPNHSTGTNPHLRTTKYTGHGIVLRAGVDTPEELSIHLEQVDKGPNYRWGNQAEGNSGGLYFYAKGKVYTAHESEIAGDHIVNNLDGLTNFGVMKNGEYRTIGMNELKAPLYDFGVSQFAELLSDNGKDKYVWPDYVSRSVMLAGSDYFILFDEVGTNWRAAGRFSWFNKNGEEFPKIMFLSPPARKDSWMTVQTPNSHGFYRDNFGSVLTLVTHKKDEVNVEGGKLQTIPLLNNTDVADFIRNKENTLPAGVAKIKTANSSDIVFRNGNNIHYKGESETFNGKAGLIRRFQDGRLEMSLFKGESISADGLSVALTPEKEAAIALSRNSVNEISGRLKTNAHVSLKIEGLISGGRLYANGVELKIQSNKGVIETRFSEGEYFLEYTTEKPTPMESRITDTEYEKDRVKIFVETSNPSESVRMEISYDGGKTWKTKGNVSKGIFYLKKENVEKVHVRAVSVNGKKEAAFAPEYPVYFTSDLPHYPEGLWLKPDQNRVHLNWGEILGTQKYRLYRKKTEDKDFQLIYEGKDRQFTDRNAQRTQKPYALPGSVDNRNADRSNLVVYEYAVTAVNGNGESIKSPVENTDPASWRNWYPDTELKFKRQSAFWMPPYVYPVMVPEKYYPEKK